MMSGIYFGFLFGVNFMLLVCEGKISLTTEKTKLTFKPGSSENITWTIDVGSAVVATRTWSFTSSGEGSTRQTLGVVSFDGAPQFPPGNPLPRFKIIKPSLLALYNVDQSYDGTYQFSLKVDGVEDEIPSNIRVFIAKKPTLTCNCSGTIIKEKGDDLICFCQSVGGNPAANVTCYNNKGHIISGTRTKNISFKLINLGVANNGTYKCEAESYPDEMYRDEVSFTVIVRARPENASITFTPKEAKIGGTVKITCDSVGVPEPRYTITHDTVPIITNSTEKTYVIKNFQQKNVGKYECIATNELGNDSDSDVLNISSQGTSSKPTPTTAIMGNNDDKTEFEEDSGGLSPGAIAGIVIGVLSFIVGVIVLVYCCKFKERNGHKGNPGVDPGNHGHPPGHHELENEEGAGSDNAYDTVNKAGGFSSKKKPEKGTLPAVYSQVNKQNREGKTLYASLDHGREPNDSERREEGGPEPTQYAHIDFGRQADLV